MVFLFQSLQIYQLSLSLVDEAQPLVALAAETPSPYYQQLLDALVAVPLRIAEANSQRHLRERQRCLGKARGEVYRAVVLLDILRRQELLAELDHVVYETRLKEVCQSLTNLIYKLEDFAVASAVRGQKMPVSVPVLDG